MKSIQTTQALHVPRTRLRTEAAVQKEIDALLDDLRKQSEVALNVGCGHNLIPGAINCDLHNPSADRQIDCTALEDFENETVDLIESHHMIEHLSFDEAERAIAEWCRVLKVGATLVITCPDLPEVLRLWLSSSRHADRRYASRMIYGSQEHPGMFHRSGYDRRHLRELLDQCGFDVEFTYSPYPKRPTPSLLVIARKRARAASVEAATC